MRLYIQGSFCRYGETMTFYDKSIWEELGRIREVLALQTTLMGFNTMRASETFEGGDAISTDSDEAWLLEIITKAETLAFPEKLQFDTRFEK